MFFCCFLFVWAFLAVLHSLRAARTLILTLTPELSSVSPTCSRFFIKLPLSLTKVLQWFSKVLRVKSWSPSRDFTLYLLWPHPSCSLLSSHSDPLGVPQTCQACPCVRALALSIPSAWNILRPGHRTAHTLSNFSGGGGGGLLWPPYLNL